MMSQEELLLMSWRSLSPTEQAQVLQFTQSLQSKHTQDIALDSDFGAPEHLEIRSSHLNEMLQEGLESLDQGKGIEVGDEWWEQERARLLARSFQNFQS
jgi:hypothetical protein